METKNRLFNRDLKKVNLFLLVTIMTSTIFFLDMFTPVEWAFWLFYTIPLILASRLFRPRGIYAFAGLCSTLFVLADILLPPHVSLVKTEISLFNTGMGMGALWGTAILLVRYRKADDAARDMDEKFRAMVEDSLVASFLVQDDRFVYFNPRLGEIFGYSRSELEDIGFLNLVSPSDRADLGTLISKVSGGELEKIAVVVQGITKGGETLAVEIFGSCTTFKDRPALIGTAVDMAWKKPAAAVLKD